MLSIDLFYYKCQIRLLAPQGSLEVGKPPIPVLSKLPFYAASDGKNQTKRLNDRVSFQRAVFHSVVAMGWSVRGCEWHIINH